MCINSPRLVYTQYVHAMYPEGRALATVALGWCSSCGFRLGVAVHERGLLY